MRLRTLWPFPDDAVKKFGKSVNQILVPELNLGQLSREVERAVRGSAEVIPFSKIGGGRMIEPEELLQLMN